MYYAHRIFSSLNMLVVLGLVLSSRQPLALPGFGVPELSVASPQLPLTVTGQDGPQPLPRPHAAEARLTEDWLTGVQAQSRSLVYDPLFRKRTIASFFRGATSVSAADVDGDGDVDVLGSAYFANAPLADLAWWENGGSGHFVQHMLASDFEGASSTCAVDLDGDDDVDILGAASVAGTIAWWENDGNQDFSFHSISSGFGGARSVYATDLDQDGDIDVLGAAHDADEIAWWENDGSEVFSHHTISSAFDGASSVGAADMDGDGDTDIVGAAYGGGEVAWWENDGQESFTFHPVASGFDGAASIQAVELDGDNDMDLLAAAYSGNQIAWWENDGSGGLVYHPIALGFHSTHAAFATDLDQDGDVDVLGASYSDGTAWWENDGSESFTARTVDEETPYALSVHAADMDDDGDIDVLGALYDVGNTVAYTDVAWWENDGSEAFLIHALAKGANGARTVYAADLDGDGDADVLGAAGDHGLSWWENDGNGYFDLHTIYDGLDFLFATSVYAADVDQDGDLDVLGAAKDANNIAWWENDGSQHFTFHVIESDYHWAFSVHASDVDGDGDLDVLGCSDAKVGWWENDGNEGFTYREIENIGAFSVVASDIDGDDDVDILSALHTGRVGWWANNGDGSFTAHIVGDMWDPRSAQALDIDQDGDVDILCADNGADEIVWWENDGHEGFSRQTIDGGFDGAISAYGIDLDRDGDIDVLGAGEEGDQVAWWENDGQELFSKHTIGTNFDQAYSVYAIDVDGDGDTDVLGAASNPGEVAWWEHVHSGPLVVDSTADSGPGTLRWAIETAGAGDTITFDPAVFPPGTPATIALQSGLPELDDGDVTIDASNAGVILNGSGIGSTPETILLDDVSLTLDGGPNLIANGAFSAGLGHWRPFDNRAGATRSLEPGDYWSSPQSYAWDVTAYAGESRTVYDTTDTSDPVYEPFDDPASTVWIAATGSSAVELRFWHRYGPGLAVLHVLWPDGEDGLGEWEFAAEAAWVEEVIHVALPPGALAIGLEFQRTHSQRWIDGLRLNSSGNVIRGLQIVGFPEHGVEVYGGAQDNVIGGDGGLGSGPMGQGNLISDNGGTGIELHGSGTMSNTVSGNHIGTDQSGTVALPNMVRGVRIYDSASYNVVGGTTPGERNLISGNRGHGVQIEWDVTYNVVRGNYIGTDVSGTSALPNTGHGIEIDDGASYTRVGGSTSGERNVVSGNDGNGVSITDGSEHNIVSGNYVGTDYTGTTALGNAADGVYIGGASYNVIGGVNATPGGACSGECNLISGNGADGVAIRQSWTMSNTVSGNYVGLDVSGSVGIGNGEWDDGVGIRYGPAYNLVGGDAPGERNVISGNGDNGVKLDGTAYNVVIGNYVGTDASGTLAIGNREDGVAFQGGAAYNRVGGGASGEGNLIGGNGEYGVRFWDSGTVSNTVSGNYIGTDLSGSGAISNTSGGIELWDGPAYNVIGGISANEGNLISGNQWGGLYVLRAGSHNRIVGNVVGIGGPATVGNGSYGIVVAGDSPDTTIEGNTVIGNVGGIFVFDYPGFPTPRVERAVILSNTVADNGAFGIRLDTSGALVQGNTLYGDQDTGIVVVDGQNHDTLTQNSIYGHAGRGIDLQGVANDGIVHPTVVYSSAVTGIVSGTACPGCRVEVFSDDEDEGQWFEGTVMATLAGDWSFAKGAPLAGPHAHATATDADGNTSEFSPPLSRTGAHAIAAGDAPPVVFAGVDTTIDCASGPGGTVTVTLHYANYDDPPDVGVSSRYWEIVSDFDGAFNCDLTFGYEEGDLDGVPEEELAGAARWDESNVLWRYVGGTVDTGANTVVIHDVTAFSPWLLISASPPQAVSDLGGTRSGSDLQLSWPAVTQDIRGNVVTPDHYVVYRRADEPYFEPDAGDIIATPSSPSFTDAGVLGDPAHNYYYLVTAVDAAGTESAPSNRLGAFDFRLVPAAQAGERMYNLIALNLKVPGVTDADSLADHVGGGVYMVICHDEVTQGIEWRLPGSAGINFPVQVGEVCFLYLDDTAPNVISLVGDVPAVGEVSFALARPAPGGSCAYNFISVPLHRDDLTDADALASDIGGVYTVSRYNAETQDLTWWMPEGQQGVNFAVRAGYPYIVCLDETAPPEWP